MIQNLFVDLQRLGRKTALHRPGLILKSAFTTSDSWTVFVCVECGLTCGEGVGAYPGYIYAADAELGQPAGHTQLPEQRDLQAGRNTTSY